MISVVIALGVVTSLASAEDTAAANTWIGLVDAGQWAQSWDAAGTLFKSQIAEPRWASTIQEVRGPLGSMSSRSVKTVTKTHSLPGAPDGEYELVQFQTNFANRTGAIETVVLAHEPTGWKVDGYFIR